jgi:hypothetical protein
MNPKIFYRILLITISVFSHAASTDRVFIEGSVSGSDDKPVKKAEVQLLDAKKKKILSIKTDKNGYFKIDEFDAQNCYLQIDKKKESATVSIRSWPLENKNLTGLKIKLSKKGEEIKKSFGPNPEIKEGGANMAEGGPPSQLTKKLVKKKKIPKKKEKVFVSGKVVNKKGKPVKKATVIVIDQNYNSVAELETDKEGLFTIENLKPADYNLTISKGKMLVKFKLKSWPKNNQNIKDIGVTLTKEKQQVNTLTFGPEPPQANAGIDQEMAYEKSVSVDGSESYNPNNII